MLSWEELERTCKGCTGCGVKRFVECPVYELSANYRQVEA